MKTARHTALVAGFIALSSALPAGQPAPIKPDAAYELATQAYLFAYPLVAQGRGAVRAMGAAEHPARALHVGTAMRRSAEEKAWLG